MSPAPYAADAASGVCRFRRPDGETRFLSTGFDGGVRVADAAYNVTVPEGWGEEGPRDLRAYVDERVEAAGFDPEPSSPALLTGVDQEHARVARLAPVTVVATAGLSNPAALPVDGTFDRATSDRRAATADGDERPPVGTVNLLVGTTRDLAPGALANLVAVASEAKAATLLAATGFPGTTSDALVVGCTPGGESTAFSGSATTVGAATRACVRDAVAASLASRYGSGDSSLPGSVADADYGVVTDERAAVSAVDEL